MNRKRKALTLSRATVRRLADREVQAAAAGDWGMPFESYFAGGSCHSCTADQRLGLCNWYDTYR